MLSTHMSARRSLQGPTSGGLPTAQKAPRTRCQPHKPSALEVQMGVFLTMASVRSPSLPATFFSVGSLYQA